MASVADRHRVRDAPGPSRAVDRHQARDAPGPSRAVVRRTVTGEAEGYNSSVAGIDIEAVRVGRGVGPTQVLAVSGGRFTFTESKVGFPMLSRTTIPDDTVIVAYIRSAAPGSRWCEIDLEPDAVIVEAPGCEHTARNLPGLDFMFAILDRESFEGHADQLGIRTELPGRGEAHLLARTAKTDLVGPTFSRFGDVAASGVWPSTKSGDDVLRAMTFALSEDKRVRRAGRASLIDSRRVVHACIDYAISIHRIPSISELCFAAHISERRLRVAFSEEYDLPPSRFFRAWALEEAHRCLSHGDRDHATVTEVATSLGFDHLGRFSGRYKETYGESPSVTLKT